MSIRLSPGEGQARLQQLTARRFPCQLLLTRGIAPAKPASLGNAGAAYHVCVRCLHQPLCRLCTSCTVRGVCCARRAQHNFLRRPLPSVASRHLRWIVGLIQRRWRGWSRLRTPLGLSPVAAAISRSDSPALYAVTRACVRACLAVPSCWVTRRNSSSHGCV
jgi:hypothetical protein